MPQNVLGILGAGQLALFTANACEKQGLAFRIFASDPSEPAAIAYPANCSFGKIGDVDALKDSFAHCTHIALESEFWSPKQLETALSGKQICPSLVGYELVYGKIKQRQLMQRLDIAQPKFFIVHNEAELKKAFEKLNQNVVLKRSTGGYDGTGNRYANTYEAALDAAMGFGLQTEAVLVEEALTLTRELALTFFASDDQITYFPPVETLQDNHVCTTAVSPANLVVAERERLENVAKLLVASGMRGLFTLEFFREERGAWYYNEIAPRPHNSQHLSMDNCEFSQYDAIVNWVLDKPMPKRVNIIGDAAMVNILGKNDSADYQLSLPNHASDVEVRTYMYGKKISRLGRKLGHLTLLGPRERILSEAKNISKGYEL